MGLKAELANLREQLHSKSAEIKKLELRNGDLEDAVNDAYWELNNGGEKGCDQAKFFLKKVVREE
jgi:hypothetical protein